MLKSLHWYCERLTSNPKNLQLIQSFQIEREHECVELYQEKQIICGLEQYLKHQAWEDDLTNKTRVYLVKTRFTKEVVSYFALKAGMISVNSLQRDVQREQKALQNGIKLVPDTISGIEISHFAINDAYRKKHSTKRQSLKGLGEYIYPQFIYPLIYKAATLIGAEIMYMYAADSTQNDEHPSFSLVKYYERLFEVKTVTDVDNYKPVTSYYDGDCIFMYKWLDL